MHPQIAGVLISEDNVPQLVSRGRSPSTWVAQATHDSHREITVYDSCAVAGQIDDGDQ